VAQIEASNLQLTARFRHLRTGVLRVSLRELAADVNRHLNPADQVSVSTVNNYEGRGGAEGPEPRASFLAALKAAYPRVNLEWLILGKGQPLVSDSAAVEFTQGRVLQALGRLSEQRLRGMRFGTLPAPAREVVLQFIGNVRISGQPYATPDAVRLPSLAPPGPQEEAWRSFVSALETILFAPFDQPAHFVKLEDLSAEERTAYVLTMVAALRPLVRSLREGPRRAQGHDRNDGSATPSSVERLDEDEKSEN
jgi:hypothetical protein